MHPYNPLFTAGNLTYELPYFITLKLMDFLSGYLQIGRVAWAFLHPASQSGTVAFQYRTDSGIGTIFLFQYRTDRYQTVRHSGIEKKTVEGEKTLAAGGEGTPFTMCRVHTYAEGGGSGYTWHIHNAVGG